MSGPLCVLIVEDQLTDAKLVAHELRKTGRAVEWERVDTAEAVRDALARTRWDVVICDWSMPGFGALAALSIVREVQPDVPFIVVSGTVGEEWAVEAMRMGARDYLIKDRLSRLVPAVDRELRERKVREARGRAEQALLSSQARYRRLVETTGEGVWTIDADSVTTFMNARMARMLGYEADEVVGMPLFAFLSDSAHVTVARHLGRHRAGIAGQVEAELKRRDGTTFWALVESTPVFDAAGCYEGALATVTDLTGRRRMEEALHRSEERLRQVEKIEAVGSLAAGIAHDFNNLLSVILGYSDMLAERLAPADPARADLDEIRAAGERAAWLTRQLLAFSRQQVLQPRLVNLDEVVERVERMLRRLIGEDIELTVLKSQTPATVQVDPGQIEQVIVNLAVNARDAMPDGGKLTIETAHVTLDAAYAAEHVGVMPGPHVMLAVTDTGVGMDEATQARMFDPFFTTKEPGRGTGLGLATVFGIVKQSGGSIWAYSEPGEGTTFKVYFPRADQDGDTPASVASDVGALHGTETILLVEDDDHVRGLVRTVLRKYGYHVVDARGGGDALLLCEQHPATIHLLLTDVVMPRMNGRQLAERIRALRPRIKVLYMSGYTDTSVVHHGVLDSDTAFVQKPVTPEVLAKKVRQVLEARE